MPVEANLQKILIRHLNLDIDRPKKQNLIWMGIVSYIAVELSNPLDV